MSACLSDLQQTQKKKKSDKIEKDLEEETQKNEEKISKKNKKKSSNNENVAVEEKSSKKKKKNKPDISSVKSFNGASMDKIKGYGYWFGYFFIEIIFMGYFYHIKYNNEHQ